MIQKKLVKKFLIFLFLWPLFKKGLWNERLYRIFDYDKSNSISYIEFLIGISKFVKEKKE